MIAARVWRGLLHVVDARARTHARTHPPVAFGTHASEPSEEVCTHRRQCWVHDIFVVCWEPTLSLSSF